MTPTVSSGFHRHGGPGSRVSRACGPWGKHPSRLAMVAQLCTGQVVFFGRARHLHELVLTCVNYFEIFSLEKHLHEKNQRKVSEIAIENGG